MTRRGTRTLSALVLGLLCCVQPASSQAPGQPVRMMDPKQVKDRIRQMNEADKQAARCAEKKDYEHADKQSELVLSIGRQLPRNWQQDSTVWRLRWRSLERLGYYAEARQIFDGASEVNSNEFVKAMENMRSLYGGLILRSTDALLNDRTLEVASVEIESKPGTASGFPFDLVQARASRGIRQALQDRDLQQDAFILPVGPQILRIKLSRESSLNYRTAELAVNIDVPPDTGSVSTPFEAFVDLSPPRKPWALVGGIAAALFTPFLMAK